MTIEYNISAIITPTPKAAIFSTSLPAAESNWLSTGITSTNTPCYLRIYVSVSVAGVLRVVRTIGSTTITENLNSGTALVANSAYMFTIEMRAGDSINIRYSTTSGTINILRINEIDGAE